jgi:hypothetical protein
MLNPELFKRLEHRFGKGHVKVNAENRPMVSSYRVDPYGEGMTSRLEIEYPGEEYHVRCPFCRDCKQRLYINHRWGVRDPVSGSDNLWLVHCWNEECFSNHNTGNRREMYNQLWEYILIGRVTHDTILTRSAANKALYKPRAMELPGAVWPLDDMKRRKSSHKAIQYVEDRLWDPVYLGRNYGVGYCLDSYYEDAKNRIIAPAYLHGKLVGWQARYVGDAPKGVAKWWTCPGFSCGSTFYNYDRMAQCQTKVIVEGPADVWNFGPQAAGLFNKNMTLDQRRLLEQCFRPDDVIVVLLDPEMDSKAKQRGDTHHIEKVWNMLITEPRFRRRVLKVYLPHGSDPDELDKEYMRLLIKEEARRNNLPVTFSRPKEQSDATRNIST